MPRHALRSEGDRARGAYGRERDFIPALNQRVLTRYHRCRCGMAWPISTWLAIGAIASNWGSGVRQSGSMSEVPSASPAFAS